MKSVDVEKRVHIDAAVEYPLDTAGIFFLINGIGNTKS